MANLDLRGFENQPLDTSGLDRLGATLHQQRVEDRQAMLDQRKFNEEQEGKKAATSKFLTSYLDPKDHLTGTAYDPQIVSGFQNILQQGQELASKGASTNDILMALGPQVSKLNQYSTTAKQINDQIKASAQKLKPYAGYNLEALESEAKKAAFYGADGKMKDISQVDPNTNWIAEVAKNNPELVTTGKGIDDFVAKTPMADYSRNVTTAYEGRSRNVKYEAKHPFWEDLQRDDKGNIITDASGNPIGLGVVGSTIMDDKGKPIVDPQTNQPFKVMDKGHFVEVMQHNPDVADFVRGQVNKHFKDAGAEKLPAEGSPQWDMMARHILYDELKNRSHSTFRTIDTQKESAPAIKIEIGRDKNAMDAIANYETAVKLKGEYSYLDPKTGKESKTNAVQAIGQIFNNNPDFLQGEQENVNGRSVVDVTPYMPGGGLKSGRGADDVYKQIYYDPTKRSLLVSMQPKVKDAKGQKPISIEEIPESKVGIFMSRIAAANGIDPASMKKYFDEQGFSGGKFKSPADYGTTVSNRLQSEQSEKIDNALKTDSWGSLKGVGTKDGPVDEVVQRSAWQLGADKYAVYTKDASGNKKKAFTTNDKAELEKYLKSGTSAPAAKKAILD